MTKFSEFNKQNLKELRTDMNALLASYGLKANLDFELLNFRFDSTVVEIKVKAKIKGATTREDNYLAQIANGRNLSLEKNKYGEKLVAYNHRSYKFPYVYEDANGKRWKASETCVQQKFGRK